MKNDAEQSHQRDGKNSAVSKSIVQRSMVIGVLKLVAT
jgi:hypothetical protein